jgi:hypothetical protein
MFSDPSRPPVLSARGTQGNRSEDYGNKTLAAAGKSTEHALAQD